MDGFKEARAWLPHEFEKIIEILNKSNLILSTFHLIILFYL